MKAIKNDISDKLVKDQEQNADNIFKIKDEFKDLNTDISNRIGNIETKQKQQLDNVKLLLETGGRSKNLVKKIITGK